jgi:hypothetical protein
MRSACFSAARPVLEHHEDAGQEVLHQVLRTETDGHPDHPRGRDDRRQVHPELAEDQHERRPVDRERGHRTQQRPYGRRPLAPPLHQHGAGAVPQPTGRLVTQRTQQRRSAALADALGHLADQPVADGPDDDRYDQDEQRPERRVHHGARRLGQPRLTGEAQEQVAPGATVGRTHWSLRWRLHR